MECDNLWDGRAFNARFVRLLSLSDSNCEMLTPFASTTHYSKNVITESRYLRIFMSSTMKRTFEKKAFVTAASNVVGR